MLVGPRLAGSRSNIYISGPIPENIKRFKVSDGVMAQTNRPFMSGVPELLVLRLLARNEMYGYELVKAILVATGETIALAQGVVYPALYGLEQRGALKARRKTVHGRTRVYYSVTAMGHRRLEQLTEDWHRVTGGISTALEEPGRA